MPVVRQCLDCVVLVPIPSSRCRKHAQAHSEWLLTIEPWRQVYSTGRWKDLALAIKRRDGGRCKFSVKGRRCANTNQNGNISVHHLTKLRLLWSQHGEPRPGSDRWDDFLAVAYDPSNLVTLCSRHHHLADSQRIGEPAEKATASRRKVEQHFRRQRAKLNNAKSTKVYTRDKRREWDD